MHRATVSGDELFLVFQGKTGREWRKQEREWEARQEAISVEILHSLPGRTLFQVGPGYRCQWLKHCLLRKHTGPSPQE